MCIFLAAILAQCMASRVVLWSVGNARLSPVHWEDFVCPIEPNNMSLLWGEVYILHKSGGAVKGGWVL